jgi:hypothetical protein
MDVDRIAFPATTCSPIPSPLILPDFLDERGQPQDGTSIPTIINLLKPRPSMGVRQKSRLPLSKLTLIK